MSKLIEIDTLLLESWRASVYCESSFQVNHLYNLRHKLVQWMGNLQVHGSTPVSLIISDLTLECIIIYLIGTNITI